MLNEQKLCITLTHSPENNIHIIIHISFFWVTFLYFILLSAPSSNFLHLLYSFHMKMAFYFTYRINFTESCYLYLLKKKMDAMGMNLGELWEMVKDIEVWCASVHGVTKTGRLNYSNKENLKKQTNKQTKSLLKFYHYTKTDFCRGPAPVDPGNSKRGRRRGGSGNNCLIKC